MTQPRIRSKKADTFLTTSYRSYKLSVRLRQALFLFGDSWGEVLDNCSKKELLCLRNFGKKSLEELQNLLRENNSDHLLK